ncbi:hypothetical protein WMF31_21615 [Sorangium sp. So ce1036]
MMKPTVAVRAKSYRVFHCVGAAIGEREYVMKLKIWLAVIPDEWSLLLAQLASPAGLLQYPRLHDRASHVKRAGS